MKETTRIMTVEITAIKKSNMEMISKEEAAEIVKEGIKDTFNADDVVVTNVQDFVLDKDGADQ